MFKSVFSKYVSAFMLIIIVSFVVVSIITASAIGRYSRSAKEEIMQTSAEASASYLSDRLDIFEGDIKAISQTDGEGIAQTLEWIVTATDDATVILTDAQGDPVLRAGNADNVIDMRKKVPDDMLRDVVAERELFRLGSRDGIFEEMKALSAQEIVVDGEIEGYVFICSSSQMLVRLWEVIVRVIMGSVLWVLLAALIAVYFISEKVIAPLREISSAAKKFAQGKFDTRVPIRGSDEVAELATAFNNMAESLDNYDNMRNTFMSDVSHDLRSPMTSISGFIDGILDGVIPPEKHNYYLQIVSNEIKRLSRLVSNLLDLSRIQAGDRKFTMVDFDICETARQILISFEQKINAKDLDVFFECEEDRIGVNADSDAIYQVLYNLCDNAVKFSCERGRFGITIKRIRGKRVLVEIFNEGAGVSPADINYVFERFYKSDKSRGLNKSGAGLGLFISKTIMDAHGQKIWVDSEYGKNCCFSFTLDAE